MILTKVPEYPRPHDFQLNFGMGLEAAVNNETTIVPIIQYDEELGVINSYKSNPQNSSFAEYAGSSCYPQSRINKVYAQFDFNMSKEALETDKVHVTKFATMEIYDSFKNAELAVDEVSTLNLNDILELQNDATDRYTYPLFNGVDMKTSKTSSNNLPANEEGLTTDAQIEGVTFQIGKYYDCLSHYTNRKKLSAITSGLKWHTLTKTNPHKSIRVQQHPSTKYMNPYAFLGLLIYYPHNDQLYQYGKPGDTTDVTHLEVTAKYRYQEFNHEFNHASQ